MTVLAAAFIALTGYLYGAAAIQGVKAKREAAGR